MTALNRLPSRLEGEGPGERGVIRTVMFWKRSPSPHPSPARGEGEIDARLRVRFILLGGK